MDVSLDVDIVTATDTYIAGREAGTVLRALYHGVSSDANVALDALTDLLPIEQIATVGLVGRLKSIGTVCGGDPVGHSSQASH